jgi:hypothetical protein
VAVQRMAATALAIRLYQIDAGLRPSDLKALVPRYLAAVPVDPFDKDGRPIRCLSAGDRPLLYSAHTNGKDDGGDFALDADGSVDDGASPDQVFFLDGRRPAAKED